MKKKLIYFWLLLPFTAYSQGVTLKAGDKFPFIPFTQLTNAPVKSIDLAANRDKKFYLINFWGTWCSPCIPEMDALAKLQKANSAKIQMIAVSDDEPAKLKNYLKTKPTTVWLATDTTYLFYNLFNLASVGHSAIVDPDRNIIAVVKTHTVTQALLDSVFRRQKVKSDATVREKPANTVADIFGVDTTMATNFTVRGYMIGQQSMGRNFRGTSFYAGRRIQCINTGLTNIYKAAYNIVSQNQVVYETDEKKINDYQNKNSLYCIDILVAPEDKDSLYVIFQKKLNAVLPVKARIAYKTIPVYVLKSKGFNLQPSDKDKSYSFSGRGYDGKGVTISDFSSDYLSNEFEMPVVNETNINGKFDLKTTLELRTRDEIMKSVEKLGLVIEKAERSMRMLILY